MSELEGLQAALHDWAERIALETCSRIREDAGLGADKITAKHWELISASAVCGAALAFSSVQAVTDLGVDTIRRLTRETP